MHVCTPSAEEVETGGSVGLTGSQPSLTGKSQVQWETPSQIR